MQDYIKNNLQNRLTLAMIAKAVNYSQWHAARIFKEYTGKTPFDYIRALRLTEAAKVLRDNPCAVLDVALDFVFDSQEGFTRAFSRRFGISPGAYREHPRPIAYFTPYNVLDQQAFYEKKGEKKKMEKTKTVFVQVMERPARKAIVKRGKNAKEYFEYCEEVGCDVWGVLESVKEALFEPAGFWLPQKLIKPGTSEYVQGVEVPSDYRGIVPEGFELIDLESCSVMVFQGEPYDDADFEENIVAVQKAIDGYDPSQFGCRFAYEDAPSFQLAPMGYRGYIEARPIVPLRQK